MEGKFIPSLLIIQEESFMLKFKAPNQALLPLTLDVTFKMFFEDPRTQLPPPEGGGLDCD